MQNGSLTVIGTPYRIILADDHSMLRDGIKVLIETKPQFKVVAEAANGQELLDLLKKIPCDLVILDLNMPILNGIEVLDVMHAEYPKIAVMVLTTHKEKLFLKRALQRGAMGYLLKEETYDKLLSAISDIRQGKKAISSEMTTYIINNYTTDLSSPLSTDLLTPREKEILSYTANGLTSKEIGERLDISSRTVEAHRANIREKLDIETMSDLVKYALDHNLM